MTLAAWQVGVVELANGRGPAPGDGRLDERDRAWFAGAVDHPGTDVVRDVVRNWRRRRLARTVPFTLLLLRRCGLLASVRERYLEATDAPSSHALDEGLQFLDRVASDAVDAGDGAGHPDHPHLATVVDLDRAVLAARGSTWSTGVRCGHPDDRLVPGPGRLVSARCDARDLLRGLLTGSVLPAPGSGHGAFLVAPGIAGCFREATAGEIRALTLIGTGCPVTEVCGLWPNDLVEPEALARLEAVGALVREPRRQGSVHDVQVLAAGSTS